MNTNATPITELAYCFGYTAKPDTKPKRIIAVSMEEGETYEQALARQQAKTERIKQKLAQAKAGSAA